MDDLISRTPADGLIAGIGSVNGSLFGEHKARCVIMAYDYTVLVGTQGYFNHKKKDRLLELAHEQRLILSIRGKYVHHNFYDLDNPRIQYKLTPGIS